MKRLRFVVPDSYPRAKRFPYATLRQGDRLRPGGPEEVAGDLSVRPAGWVVCVLDAYTFEAGSSQYVAHLFTKKDLLDASSFPTQNPSPNPRYFYAIPGESAERLERDALAEYQGTVSEA